MAATDFAPGFQAQSIAVDGVTLNVHVGGNGPPVVPIHGYAETSAMWGHPARFPETASTRQGER